MWQSGKYPLPTFNYDQQESGRTLHAIDPPPNTHGCSNVMPSCRSKSGCFPKWLSWNDHPSPHWIEPWSQANSFQVCARCHIVYHPRIGQDDSATDHIELYRSNHCLYESPQNHLSTPERLWPANVRNLLESNDAEKVACHQAQKMPLSAPMQCRERVLDHQNMGHNDHDQAPRFGLSQIWTEITNERIDSYCTQIRR